jgi:hypothetical protein
VPTDTAFRIVFLLGAVAAIIAAGIAAFIPTRTAEAHPSLPDSRV